MKFFVVSIDHIGYNSIDLFNREFDCKLGGITMSVSKHDTDQEFQKLTVSRFQKYARFWTTSDRHSNDTPSTPGQWDLAKALAEELRSLGIKDTILTDHS